MRIAGNMVVGLVMISALGCGPRPMGTDGGSDAGTPQTPLQALEKKRGTYEGEWRLYRLDGAQQRQQIFGWTDVATATNPRVEAKRAYLEVTDQLMFQGGGGTTQRWLEGVIIEVDGSVGQTFIDMDGVITLQTEVSEGRFVYRQALGPSDLLAEGATADNLVRGWHEYDKVVTFPNDVETHTVKRTTHLEWFDRGTGMLQKVAFESLSGTHRKKP